MVILEKKGKKGKYRVKLSHRNKKEITVNGITITQNWKKVKEKTNKLESLEKKGEIIIEEVEDVGTDPDIDKKKVMEEFASGFVSEFERAMKREQERTTKEFEDRLSGRSKIFPVNVEEIRPIFKDKTEIPKDEKKIEKIHWLGSKEEIEYLFTLLINEHIVVDNGKFEMIANHFKNKDGNDFKYEKSKQRFKRIHWLLSEREIVYFLKKLCDRYLFLEDKKFKMLSIHFKNIKGKDFNPIQLANAYQQKGKHYKKIDEIMGKFDNFRKKGES